MFKKEKIILFLLVCVSFIINLSTPPAQAAAIEAPKIDDLLQKNNFSGNLLIVKKGHYWFEQQSGYANYAQRRLLNKDSVYQLASLEKSITATLIIKAQTQHKLELTNSLQQYFPQIPYSANLTLTHLMQMQSGLNLTTEPTTNLRGQKLDHYLDTHTSFDSHYVNRWHYSDVNYILLARILVQVYHCSYQTLFKRYFKQRLHLKDTDVNNQFVFNPNHVLAYAVNKQPADYNHPLSLNQQRLNFEGGAGQLYSNVREFYRIQAAIVNGKIVDRHFIRQFRQVPPTNPTNGYNGGVYNDKSNHYFYAHGLEQGFDTVFLMSNNAQNAIILFSNRHNPYGTNTIDLVKKLYQQVF